MLRALNHDAFSKYFLLDEQCLFQVEVELAVAEGVATLQFDGDVLLSQVHEVEPRDHPLVIILENVRLLGELEVLEPNGLL